MTVSIVYTSVGLMGVLGSFHVFFVPCSRACLHSFFNVDHTLMLIGNLLMLCACLSTEKEYHKLTTFFFSQISSPDCYK